MLMQAIRGSLVSVRWPIRSAMGATFAFLMGARSAPEIFMYIHAEYAIIINAGRSDRNAAEPLESSSGGSYFARVSDKTRRRNWKNPSEVDRAAQRARRTHQGRDEWSRSIIAPRAAALYVIFPAFSIFRRPPTDFRWFSSSLTAEHHRINNAAAAFNRRRPFRRLFKRR